MSSKFAVIPTRALHDKRLGNAHVSALAALSAYADRDGWCRPSQAVIAQDLGISRRVVVRHLRVLRDCGYILSTRRETTAGAEDTCLYRVLHDTELPRDHDRAAQTTAEGLPQDVEGGRALRAVGGRASGAVGGRAPRAPRSTKKEDTPPKGVPPKASKISQLLPVDFREFVKEHGLVANPERELPQFRDWCRSKGRVYKDYRAAFRNWLRKADQFARDTRGWRGPRRGNGEDGTTYIDEQGVERSIWSHERVSDLAKMTEPARAAKDPSRVE